MSKFEPQIKAGDYIEVYVTGVSAHFAGRYVGHDTDYLQIDRNGQSGYIDVAAIVAIIVIHDAGDDR